MHSYLMDFEVIKDLTIICLFEFINKIHIQFAVQTNIGVMIFRPTFSLWFRIASQYHIEVEGRQVQEFDDKLKFNF